MADLMRVGSRAYARLAFPILALAASLALAQEEAAKSAILPLTSLDPIRIREEQLPEGWRILDEPVTSRLDELTRMTIEAMCDTWDIDIEEEETQTFDTGDHAFNVFLYLFEHGEGVPQVIEFLQGYLSPKGWSHWARGNVVAVLATRDRAERRRVGCLYAENYMDHLFDAASGISDESRAGEYRAEALRIGAVIGGLYLHELDDFARAVAVYERAAAGGESEDADPETMWLIYEGIGMAGAFSRDLERAEKGFVRAVELAEGLDDARSAHSNYNAACLFAEKGDSARALEHLEEAFKADRRQGESGRASQAPSDESLKSLWDDEEFKRLVEEYGG